MQEFIEFMNVGSHGGSRCRSSAGTTGKGWVS